MNIFGLSCGIFEKEIRYLIENKRIDIPFQFLDSSLHMYPQKLNLVLDKKIEKLRNENKKIIIVYGECHAFMIDVDDDKYVYRTPGINCIQIILGTDRYRKLRKEGAFIFMPEWIERWKEIFSEHLGLKGELGKEMINDMHSKLVYIKTPCYEDDSKYIDEVREYFDMKVDIEYSDLSFLEDSIKNGVKVLRNVK
ncbi:MAG: hypothetical protein C0601_00610 [Candidatus Muiribacterium halophilum]|uniref:DUF1638 domain-containing protein n=1 Tax=Muiribacterium halophilum TaxID=2053465 RepID=A0A2N5ZMY9_MUIH1|nr:MAG: hypothetical protein C0601_00610 [Candidatus Muirbacterium halophilum]